MQNSNDTVDDAVHVFESDSIPRYKALSVMNSSAIDVLGVARHYLADERIMKAISPPLDFDDVHRFMIRYTEKCIFDDPESPWASGACLAGHEFVSYVQHQWLAQRHTRQVADEMVPWLERIYRQANPETRKTIQLCILEHLVGTKIFGKEFEYWKHDSDLKEVYQEALGDSMLMG